MQVTHLSESECSFATAFIRTMIKHKAHFSQLYLNAFLFLNQALELINLFAHQQQSHITNIFLMANSSFHLIQSLFFIRLLFIQYHFLIPISPLNVTDWSP